MALWQTRLLEIGGGVDIRNMKRRTGSLVVLVLMLVTIVSITTASGPAHVFSGGYPVDVVQNLRYVVSGGTSNYQQNIMIAGANQWNGISSKVNLSTNSSGARMSILQGSTPVQGLLGEMKPYKRDMLGQWLPALPTDVWHATDVIIYENQFAWLAQKGVPITDVDRRATLSHEVGHALSLAHTNDIPTVENMDQGLGKAPAPTSVDKFHLTLKWGY